MLKKAKFIVNPWTWLHALLMLVIVSGCKTRGYNLSSVAGDKSNSIILVHCMSAQGNGGNWSSTLGWIAADYLQIADRAELAARDASRPVYIYPRCFSGGSSGSAVTNVVMSLLSNYAVLSPGDGNDGLRKAGFFTASDMREYAKAIRFLGLSTDMTVLETAYFLAGTLKDTAFAQSKLPDSSKQANWWSGVQASAEGAVLDFSKIVFAASRITREDLNRDIDVVFGKSSDKMGVLNSLKERIIIGLNDRFKDGSGQSLFDNLKQFAKENQISTVSDFPRERAVDDLNCSVDVKKCAPGRIRAALFLARDKDPSLENAQKRYAKFYLIEAFQAYYAGSYVDGLVARDPLNKASFSKQFAAAAKAQGGGGALAESLRQPLDPGYFTFTAAGLSWDVDPKTPKREREFYKTAPTFDALRFVIFSDKSTAAAIRKSPLYVEQSKLCKASSQQEQIPVCRFVIGEIEHRVHSMLPSVREPGLMAELYAPGYSVTAGITEHLGVKRFFDPNKAQAGKTLEEAVLDLKQSASNPAGKSLYFAVAGGWPDRRVGAWMLMYYLDTLLSNDPDYGVKAQFAKALGVSTAEPGLVASVSIFGKPDSTADAKLLNANVNDAGLLQKFDVKQVSSVFSKGSSSEMPLLDSAVSRTSRASYLNMMGLFYGFFTGESGRLDRDGIPVQLMETMNNWDLSEVKGLPAYLAIGSDSGASRYLLSLSHNTVNEGLLALDQKLPPNNADSKLQYCSLATFQRDKTKKLDIRQLPNGTFFKEIGKGDVTMNRIQCVRRMNSETSGEAYRRLFNKTYREELSALAEKTTVTFNVLDPRINLGRKDAGLVIRDVSTNAPLVISSDELPAITAEQKEILLMPDESVGN
jgi:hypothetical protein